LTYGLLFKWFLDVQRTTSLQGIDVSGDVTPPRR
jgi:hypothetical protein